MRIAGRVERHLRREQPRRRWKKTTRSSLPRLDWTDGEVEKVEKTTARLLMDWATCLRGGERAQRRRRAVGNGGATADTALRVEKAREGNGAVSAFGQELALFWSTDVRHGDLGSA